LSESYCKHKDLWYIRRMVSVSQPNHRFFGVLSNCKVKTNSSNLFDG